MLRLAFTGIVTALLMVPGVAAPARADAGGDAAAIVKQAIAAKGGEEALKKYAASTSKFKGTVSVMGMDVAMSGTSKEQAPDKQRLEAEMKFGGMDVAFTQIINGDKAWQGVPGAIEPVEGEQLAELREGAYAGRIVDLRGLSGKGVKLTALPEAKVDGKAAVGVKVSADGHRDVSLYFDKDSHLLVKSEAKGKDPMSGENFKGETYYGDYKKVDGLMLPHKVRVMRDGTKFMEMEMTSVTLAEKLDDKDFTNKP